MTADLIAAIMDWQGTPYFACFALGVIVGFGLFQWVKFFRKLGT